MKNNKGITLVALVITIIILIILAGITMSLVLGEGGLINRAQQGAEKYSDESVREAINLSAIAAVANTEGIFDKVVFRTQLNEYFGEGNYTYAENAETGEITITVKGKEYKVSANGNLIGVEEAANTYDPASDPTLGSDTSSTTWDPEKASGEAKLDLGETVNLRLKKIAALANGVDEEELDTWTVYNSEDTYITRIEWFTGNVSNVQKVPYGQLAMTSDSALGMDADGTTNELIESDVPIWAWYSNGTIYIWSSDSTIDMHPHSERMFQGMKSLTTVSALEHFASDSVTTLRCLFADGKMGSFGFAPYSPLSNWNISNVKTSLKAGQENLPANNGFYKVCPGVKYGSSGMVNAPDFTERPGIWDREGTYFADSTKCMAYDMGDEITIGSQNFYVLENCGSLDNDIIVLAKFPLNVDGTEQVTSTTDNYNVAFSSSYYWADEWSAFYDPTRTDVEWNTTQNRPEGNLLDLNNISGYTDSDAIGKAKSYATSVGGNNGRLMTQEEYIYYSSSTLNSRSGGYKVTNVKYWTSSALQRQPSSSYYNANDMIANNSGVGHYNTANIAGVRPILTLPRSSVTLVQQRN